VIFGNDWSSIWEDRARIVMGRVIVGGESKEERKVLEKVAGQGQKNFVGFVFEILTCIIFDMHGGDLRFR